MSNSAEALDTRAFRNALGNFPTGVTVMTAHSEEHGLAGVTANSFSSVSLDPPLILWSIGKDSTSLKIFQAATHFAVNVLSAEQKDLSNHFAQRSTEKFDGMAFEVGAGGSPILPNTAASFECEVFECVEGGDHWIMLGRVLKFTNTGSAPLVFHKGQYSSLAPF